MAKKKRAPQRTTELAVPGRQQIRDAMVAGVPLPDPGALLINIFSALLGTRIAGELMTDKVLKRVKSRPVEVLGTGAMGVAFLLDNGNVLKLTRDRDELEAAQVLVDKRNPNVIRFYDVFIARNGHGVGVIVRGRVDHSVGKLSQYSEMLDFVPLKQLLTRATDKAAFQLPEGKEPSRKDLLRAMEVWLDYLSNFTPPPTTRAQAILNDAVAGVEFLKGCGVYGFDFHAGNVGVVTDAAGMMHGVIYDIGLTSSRARRGIDTERVTLEEILPVFGRMVSGAKKNPIPTVRA